MVTIPSLIGYLGTILIFLLIMNITIIIVITIRTACSYIDLITCYSPSISSSVPPGHVLELHFLAPEVEWIGRLILTNEYGQKGHKLFIGQSMIPGSRSP